MSLIDLHPSSRLLACSVSSLMTTTEAVIVESPEEKKEGPSGMDGMGGMGMDY